MRGGEEEQTLYWVLSITNTLLHAFTNAYRYRYIYIYILVLRISFVFWWRFSVIIALYLHAMFSTKTSFWLYLNGHEDESAYKEYAKENDEDEEKKRKKKKKEKYIEEKKD